jgi:predicted TIM-barrel enzyme
MTSTLLRDLFGTPKPVIAMLHACALPGRPRHDAAKGLTAIKQALARDLDVLQQAGVHGLLFCNEADLPYQLRTGPEIAAAMAALIGQLRARIRRPFGVDIVWDPVASLAVARATGGSFVREAVTGVYESDLGVMRPSFGDLEDLRTVKAEVPGTPVLASTGVTADTVNQTLHIADGVIVGTHLKRDGVTWNPVDPDRAAAFMAAAAKAQKAQKAQAEHDHG